MAVGWIELLVGLLVLMLFLLLAVAAVVVIVWYFARKKEGTGALTAPEDPLDTLRKRYAHGEITREEYLQIRQDLIEDRP